MSQLEIMINHCMSTVSRPSNTHTRRARILYAANGVNGEELYFIFRQLRHGTATTETCVTFTPNGTHHRMHSIMLGPYHLNNRKSRSASQIYCRRMQMNVKITHTSLLALGSDKSSICRICSTTISPTDWPIGIIPKTKYVTFEARTHTHMTTSGRLMCETSRHTDTRQMKQLQRREEKKAAARRCVFVSSTLGPRCRRR